jgi:hypothetical protein
MAPMAQGLPPFPPVVSWSSHYTLLDCRTDSRHLSAYSAVMGAVTNWESPIYLQLLSVYSTTIDNLNIGAALMLLLLGAGNLVTTPLSNSESHQTP